MSSAIIGPNTNTLANYCSSHEGKCSCSHFSAGGIAMEMMYDSGSSITLARKDMMSPQMNNVAQFPLPVMKLVTATVNDLLMTDYIQTTVQIQYHTVNHMFEVVNTLITPAILGMDFLQQHGLSNRNNTDPILRPILQAECNL